MVAVSEAANVLAMLLIITRRFRALPNNALIHCSNVLSIATLALLAVASSLTSNIGHTDAQVLVLLATFSAASISCASPLLYLPFAADYDPCYVTAVIFGGVLSECVTHVCATFQGITNAASCRITNNPW